MFFGYLIEKKPVCCVTVIEMVFLGWLVVGRCAGCLVVGGGAWLGPIGLMGGQVG